MTPLATEIPWWGTGVLTLVGSVVGILLTQWFSIYSSVRKRRDDRDTADIEFRRSTLENLMASLTKC
jgi:hypothetical protein